MWKTRWFNKYFDGCFMWNVPFQLEQSSQAFPFGTAVVDAQIAGDSVYNLAYQDCFHSHFNWAVLENALKWTNMEPEQVKTKK